MPANRYYDCHFITTGPKWWGMWRKEIPSRPEKQPVFWVNSPALMPCRGIIPMNTNAGAAGLASISIDGHRQLISVYDEGIYLPAISWILFRCKSVFITWKEMPDWLMTLSIKENNLISLRAQRSSWVSSVIQIIEFSMRIKMATDDPALQRFGWRRKMPMTPLVLQTGSEILHDLLRSWYLRPVYVSCTVDTNF